MCTQVNPLELPISDWQVGISNFEDNRPVHFVQSSLQVTDRSLRWFPRLTSDRSNQSQSPRVDGHQKWDAVLFMTCLTRRQRIWHREKYTSGQLKETAEEGWKGDSISKCLVVSIFQLFELKGGWLVFWWRKWAVFVDVDCRSHFAIYKVLQSLIFELLWKINIGRFQGTSSM